MRTVIFHKNALYTVFLVCAILLMGCDRQLNEKKHIHVVFRLDDYSIDDYSTRSSTDIELRIIDAFRKNGDPITFGVIPFDWMGRQNIVPITSKKGNTLRIGFKDGILDIALHGYSHKTINNKKKTEFSGLDYDSQVERLTKGKKILEGIINAPVTTFVPPWNQYDLNTLRALEQLGFSTLSADKNGEVTEDSKLNFLPASCGLTQLRDAVEAARTSSDDQPLIIVLFHTYDFRELDETLGSITFQEFSDLLNWLKSKKDVRLLSISQATKVIKDLSANRFVLRKLNYSLNKFLPSLLKGELSTFLYEESADMPKTLLKVVGFYLMIVILGIVFSFSLGCLVFPRSEFIMKIYTIGSIVFSAIILIYALHDLKVYRRGMMVCAGAIGASIGVCICFNYMKNKRTLVRNSSSATHLRGIQ